MRKILTVLLAAGITPAFAATTESSTSSTKYSAFQEYDREYNVGYGVTSGNLSNGSGGAVNNSQYLNLELERLFNVGVWLDVNASLVSYYSQAADPAAGPGGITTGSQPSFGGVNVKVGYAFPLITDSLMLTPYALGGRNTNFASYTLAATPSTTNLTSDYYWSGGVGARLEYRLNSVFDFYADQSAVYNASQAPTTQGLAVNDNYAYTSTLGAKFNLYRNFQLGAQAFYNDYYYTQALVTSTGVALVPQSSVGGLISVGLSY